MVTRKRGWPPAEHGEDGWLKIRVLLADLLRLALRLVLPVICESDNPPNGTVPWRNCAGGSPRRSFRGSCGLRWRTTRGRRSRGLVGIRLSGRRSGRGGSTLAMGPRSWLRGNWCSNYFGAGRRARRQSAGSPPQGLHKQLWSESSWRRHLLHLLPVSAGKRALRTWVGEQGAEEQT